MHSTSSFRSNRGSALIVALIFSGVIAISLGAYLRMATNAATIAQRSFLANDSMNITEAALEQGLWTFNQNTAGVTNVWSNGWSTGLNSDDKRRTLTNFNLSQNATGSAQIYVKYYNSTGIPAPMIIAKSTVTPRGGQPINKWVEVTLKRRSYFSTGLVGKRGVTFNGNNTTVDSWISGVDVNPSSPTAYSVGVRRAHGSVAAVNVDSQVAVQNANIYGYVSVGSSNTATAVTIGSNGIISGDFSSPSGFKDPERIAGNFTADLINADIPPNSTYNRITSHAATIQGGTLPSGGDLMNLSDSTYYYRAKEVDLDPAHGGSPSLVIAAGKKVVLILEATAGQESFATGGTGSITINAGASLAIYTAGNVRIAGNGVLNLNGATTAFSVFGQAVSPSTQTIQVAGNGGLTGIIHAPNGTVTVTGNGDVKGAITGDTITLNGNGNFHYDESLANWGGNNPFKVKKWRELVSASDRAAYASHMSF